jgi:hypothetical protein
MSIQSLFTCSGSDPLRKAKCSTGVKRTFDRSIKSYVATLKGPPTVTLSLPKNQRLSLGITHRFITVQLFVPLGHNCSISLRLSDTNHCRYRLILSTAVKSSNAQKLKPGNPLHFQVPLSLQRNCWCRVVLDVAQLTQATFGEINEAMFRTVDGLSVSAHCRVRNIYSTLDDPLSNGSIVPHNLEIIASKVNDIFVDGTDKNSLNNSHQPRQPCQPRQPRPSPVPTLPTPSGVLNPSMPTPSKINLAFGTRVEETSLMTPTYVTPKKENTPPRSSSRRRTPGGSAPRRDASSRTKKGNKKDTSSKKKQQLRNDVLPDDFYTYDRYTQSTGGGGPLSAPSPAVTTYVDRAASPIQEETLTPSSRYGSWEEQLEGGDCSENVEPPMTPVQQTQYGDLMKEEEQAQEKEKIVPACPIMMPRAMPPPPPPPTSSPPPSPEKQVYADAPLSNKGTLTPLSRYEYEEDVADFVVPTSVTPVQQTIYTDMKQNEELEQEVPSIENEVSEERQYSETLSVFSDVVSNGAADDGTDNVVEEEAEARIAFLYSQLEMKRRQIQRMEAEFNDVDDFVRNDNTDNTDITDITDNTDNDEMVLMEDSVTDDEEEELVFDPILQCFYSPKTNM